MADVFFIGTDGDTAELDAIHEARVDMDVGHRFRYGVVPPRKRGDYAAKINYGYQHTDEPFMLFGADDLDFHPGWYEAAVALMDDETAVVGTQDLANSRVLRGEHATHPLVARWYIDQVGTIDEPGKALHEGYPHEFVDDEFVETAKARQVWAFADDSIVEHLHPSVGKGDYDELYRAEPQRMTAGRLLYNRRKHLWTSRS